MLPVVLETNTKKIIPLEMSRKYVLDDEMRIMICNSVMKLSMQIEQIQ